VKRPPVAGQTGRKPFVERERERKRLIDAKRANSTGRGYDGAWRALRGEFLAANPLCSKAGCRLPATDVDHIRAVRDRPDLRLIWSNLRSFCHVHHSRHTARTQGFARPGNEC
jgi:5-methylcytosine-specific restriction enzyme A